MTWLPQHKSQSNKLRKFLFEPFILIKNKTASLIKYPMEGPLQKILLLVTFEWTNKMALFHHRLQNRSIIRPEA